MRRVLLATWGLVLLELGCGQTTDPNPGGSATGAAGGGSGSAAGSSAGGAAGSGDPVGGGAQSGGSGGQGGDNECQCLAMPLSWRHDGGRVASQARSSIEPCNAFHHETGPNGGEPTASCDSLLEKCNVGLPVNLPMLRSALAHAHVQAAIAAAPVLYGGDTRPVDGSVRSIDIGGKVIEVGVDCAGSPNCEPIPQGVAALADLLWTIEDQQLSFGACNLPQ